MKKFLLQTFFFSLLAIMIIIIIHAGATAYIKKRLILKTRPGITMIVTGHSHPECAFNDSLIQDLQNFSKSGEAYFYTYYKLTALLKQNPQIKTVFIDYSNDAITEIKDRWTWGSTYMGYLYPEYGLFIDKEGNRLLRNNNPKAWFNNQSRLMQRNLLSIANSDYDYSTRIGKYMHLVRQQLNPTNASQPTNQVDRTKLFRLSNTNITYLEKIITLCKQNAVKLFLIRSPIHPNSSDLINEKLYNQVYFSKFRSVEFLDFKNFPLKDEEYGNDVHLNFKGARKFSVFFDSLVKQGLLESQNKQGIINQAISTETFSMSAPLSR
jgi:hypothetical protein